MSSEKEIKIKKQLLVLVTSILVTIARKKAVKKIKDDENPRTTVRADENNENPKFNLAQVLYI